MWQSFKTSASSIPSSQQFYGNWTSLIHEHTQIVGTAGKPSSPRMTHHPELPPRRAAFHNAHTSSISTSPQPGTLGFSKTPLRQSAWSDNKLHEMFNEPSKSFRCPYKHSVTIKTGLKRSPLRDTSTENNWDKILLEFKNVFVYPKAI